MYVCECICVCAANKGKSRTQALSESTLSCYLTISSLLKGLLERGSFPFLTFQTFPRRVGLRKGEGSAPARVCVCVCWGAAQTSLNAWFSPSKEGGENWNGETGSPHQRPV